MQTGDCEPNCGGGIIEQHYIITQEAAGGGNVCPDFVRQNTTEMIECCRKLILITHFSKSLKSCVCIIQETVSGAQWRQESVYQTVEEERNGNIT